MTKQLPKISIIIPVYNVEEYITECLQSVMRQTYTGAIECILVDDCGKDKSIAIAEQLISTYKGTISFRILHHDHNRGLSAARNTGTDAATGEYVYFLDSDDYISNDCFDALTAPLAIEEHDIIIGNYSVVGSDWGVPKLCAEEGQYTDDILFMYCTGKLYMMAWNKLYKLSFIKSHELYFKEGILHEDDHLSFRAFTGAKSVYVVQHETYFYLIRENGIMSLMQYTQRNRDSYAETLLIIADYVQKHKEVQPVVHEWLNNRYLKLIVQISNQQRISFFAIYKNLRNVYTYPLIEQFRRKIIKKGKFAMRLHYLMSVRLGYIYLKLFSRYIGYEKI